MCVCVCACVCDREREVFADLDSKCLVDFVLHRQTVAVPAKPSGHMEPTLVCIARHYILHIEIISAISAFTRGPRLT